MKILTFYNRILHSDHNDDNENTASQNEQLLKINKTCKDLCIVEDISRHRFSSPLDLHFFVGVSNESLYSCENSRNN